MKLTTILVCTAGLAFGTVAVAPTAGATICPGVNFNRHFGPQGCENVAENVSKLPAIASSTFPYFPGEQPCFTVEGVSYYTPPGDPC